MDHDGGQREKYNIYILYTRTRTHTHTHTQLGHFAVQQKLTEHSKSVIEQKS